MEKTKQPVVRKCERQVAGHRFENGRAGSLVDDAGRFYKPLQGGARGDTETNFYDEFWANEEVTPDGKKFFPKYFGIVELEAVDGSGLTKHAIMEDLTSGYSQPCITDIKMGRRTWGPDADAAYIAKCTEKDTSSTSASLGFRIAGMRVSHAPSDNSSPDTTWSPDRQWFKTLLTKADVEDALRRFTSLHPLEFKGKSFNASESASGSCAAEVYGGDGGVLEQLADLKKWFQAQTSYHFYATSILIIYEGDTRKVPSTEEQSEDKSSAVPTSATSNQSGRRVKIKLIDFAHVVPGNGKIDERLIEAIDALVEILKGL
eukprot:TRINITY_DN20520_c3_g1_i1.p1 TRINITY_DN20520_c3_g1~~TRINITY_DN20520_c3_g1_i1.p1  ORF type:complete len:317 (-),score=53.48 TRINITY_DN20520_c3_g1_i1:261-1211(-)